MQPDAPADSPSRDAQRALELRRKATEAEEDRVKVAYPQGVYSAEELRDELDAIRRSRALVDKELESIQAHAEIVAERAS